MVIPAATREQQLEGRDPETTVNPRGAKARLVGCPEVGRYLLGGDPE